MNALPRLVVATAAALCATVAIGCDTHPTPVTDTTRTTGADLNAMGAADRRDAGVSSAAVVVVPVPVPVPVAAAAPAAAQPPPPQIELDAPVAAAPVAPAATTVRRAPATTSGDSNPASTFVGTSFGPTPVDTSASTGSNP